MHDAAQSGRKYRRQHACHDPTAVVQAYAALSVDGPEHFAVVFDKLHRTWTEPTGLEIADLASITAHPRAGS
jgi:hypothetical protein